MIEKEIARQLGKDEKWEEEEKERETNSRRNGRGGRKEEEVRVDGSC